MASILTVDRKWEIRPSSASNLNLYYVLAALLFCSYQIVGAFYNVYFHPLHNIPGPKLWIAFPIFRHIAGMRGLLDVRLRQLHNQYGEVVRFSAEEVSFITAQAWKDIYGHGHGQMRKWVFGKPGDASDIINANDENHTRFRKALAHAFSEKSLRDQEPLLKVYIDMMIDKLKDIATSGASADMVKWYNLTTFDMIGDLAFGESFGGLKDTKYHEWVATIFQTIKFLPFVRAAQEYTAIIKLIVLILPKSISKAGEKLSQHIRDSVARRISNTAQHGRGDFMDSMLKHRGEKDGLTDAELVSNSGILIIAGSETTATLLSGVTYWLLRTPEAMRKVTREVREAFDREDEINFINATSRLPYMLACLDEGLRIYPPIPTGLQRYTPSGPPTNISGYEISAGTLVSVHQTASYWSPTNFHLPHEFHPERFLPQDSPSPFANDNRAVFQPFSTGPRNCIGRNLAYNEMRLILARILWNFDLELCDESQGWAEKQKTYMLWEKGPLQVRLRLRKM